MTRQRYLRLGYPRLINRRPEQHPGRRFAFRSVLVLTSLALPGTAVAGQPVVQATVYSATGVTHPSLSLSALDGCATYSGQNQLPLYPGGADYTVPSSSAWALATVLSCGLKVPVSGVTIVLVQRSSGAFEAPLTSQDLAAGAFQDPSAQPLIANNGGAMQNTYFRPWRGGNDQNASDIVTANGPIAIVVAASGQLLQVTVHHHRVARTSSGAKVQFSATVQSPSGGGVSAGSLTWNWSFGDSSSATAPSPTHPFTAGVYPVTVLVTDAGTGEVGTATIDLRVGRRGGQGPTPRLGGGRHPRSQSPTGPERSRGNRAGGPAGHRSTPGSGGTHGSHPRSPDATGNVGSSPNHREATRPRGARAARRQSPRRSKPRSSPIKPALPVERLAPVVSGLLVSDVHPLPPSEIQLVHQTPAPPASAPSLRTGGGVSPLPVLAGALCLAALFGYGAARELRGQRGGAVQGQLT